MCNLGAVRRPATRPRCVRAAASGRGAGRGGGLDTGYITVNQKRIMALCERNGNFAAHRASHDLDSSIRSAMCFSFIPFAIFLPLFSIFSPARKKYRLLERMRPRTFQRCAFGSQFFSPLFPFSHRADEPFESALCMCPSVPFGVPQLRYPQPGGRKNGGRRGGGGTKLNIIRSRSPRKHPNRANEVQ